MKKNKTKRKSAYLDPTLSIDERVRDLLRRMTIEEKIRQMSMCTRLKIVKNGKVSLTALRKSLKNMSIGCMQDPQIEPKKSAADVNTVQKYLVEKTRLGIPALIVSECLHGHYSGGSTVFPQVIGMASTWNPELIRRMAEAAAKEARAVGVAQSLSPDLDLARDPRWGRVEETYGEDPYLVSRMGTAYIRGMQGEKALVDRSHLVCTAKHYTAHGSPEAGMNLAPVAGGLRELRTVYLPPFQAAVTEANVLSIMPAYNEYDGIPASASKLLLTRILREEWGFEGYVFSDYRAIAKLHYLHKTAHTPAEAGQQALEAGMDLEAPRDYGFGDRLLTLARKGEVSIDQIDQAVTRILRIKFIAGLFENPYADTKEAARVVNCPAHRKLARTIAQEAIILLKNENKLLPLKPDIKTLAVIGPNADAVQLGDYSKFKAGAVTPLQGIRNAVSRRTKILHEQGCGLYDLSRNGFEKAVEAAKKSDVAIVVIGGSSMISGGTGWGKQTSRATCGEGFDRTELTPPGVQEDLVRAIYETGTPTIVVLIHGRPYSISWIAEHIPAIIEAWYPGEEGGNALADVLFGKVNPSGKLPVTIPRSVGHVPVFYNHKPSARGFNHKWAAKKQPSHDYVFSSPTPLFPFGYGLSYTTFKYKNLQLAPGKIQPGGRVTVKVDVLNSGKVTGREVVQLYVNDVVSSVTTPVKVLRRFAKITLKPGEQKTVSFVLLPKDLMLLDENMNWIVEPGTFEVMVSQLKKTFSVTSQH